MIPEQLKAQMEEFQQQVSDKTMELEPLLLQMLDAVNTGDLSKVAPALVQRANSLSNEIEELGLKAKQLLAMHNDKDNEQTATAVIQDVAQEPTFLHVEDDEFTPEAIADNKGYADLRKAVHARVLAYFGPAGVPQDMIVPYGELLCEDIEKELEKFARGQREHGGDIRDRDLDAEIEPELIDARIYHRCKKLQRSYIKLNVE